MSRIFAMLCLISVAAPSAGLAQECNRSDQSQIGMNICADADYKAADVELNKAYGEILKRLADDAGEKKLIQAAQRAWIAFRDAECAFSTDGSKDGSIYPMLLSLCLVGVTDARTEQLSGYLKCEEGDMSCPVPAAQ